MEEKTLQKSLDTTLLQQIQDLLATATDLAYNIVDYKGCPINKFSNFSAFCTTIRSCKEGMEICSDINARSGFEAALRGKPFLFQCPGGLIDLAVPIIINGNFWGTVCFGQVRTDKKEIPLLKSDKNIEKVFEKFKELNFQRFIDRFNLQIEQKDKELLDLVKIEEKTLENVKDILEIVNQEKELVYILEKEDISDSKRIIKKSIKSITIYDSKNNISYYIKERQVI